MVRHSSWLWVCFVSLTACSPSGEPQSSEPNTSTSVESLASTWNRGALPSNAVPVPGHYIGTCSVAPLASCTQSSDCPIGESCNGGQCWQCAQATDCAAGQTCNGSHQCSGGSPCYADSQCFTGQVCGNGTCSVSTSTTCHLNSQCPTGEKCIKFTDLAFKGSSGVWFIDYGANQYAINWPPPTSHWDYAFAGYGDSSAVPAPADYDGDGYTDLSVKDSSGTWYIDYSSNGFGGWDFIRGGYRGATAIPVPGDYDGDGKADLAVKDSNGGLWLIDYARSPGYTGFDVQSQFNYGDANSIPVPADYDGDGLTDIAIKNNTNGTWSIDYMWNGIGRPTRLGTFQYDLSLSGYGTATPYPADYDNDGKADIAEKDANGVWLIDYASTGFGSWDPPTGGYPGYGGTSTAVPADYNHDGKTDLSVVDPATGTWYVDFAPTWGNWDLWPTTQQFAMDNADRTMSDENAPRIVSTAVYNDAGVSTTSLTIGSRYTVDIAIQPGASSVNTYCSAHALPDGAGCTSYDGYQGQCYAGACVDVDDVDVNPAFVIPSSLRIHDGSTWWPLPARSCSSNADCGSSLFGDSILHEYDSSDCYLPTHRCNTHRRFTIECSQPGSYVLAYELRNTPIWQNPSAVLNPDYGLKVDCTAANLGLYGTVTSKGTGTPIVNATVTLVETGQVAHTASNGTWQMPSVTGGPYTVRVTDPVVGAHSDAVGVNVVVPAASGFELDTALEEAFTPLPSGVTYTTYIDYSRNRTVYHVVKIPSSQASRVSLAQSSFTYGACGGNVEPDHVTTCTNAGYPSCPVFDDLKNVVQANNALVAINAVWWDVCSGNALGYMWNGSLMPSFAWCDGGSPVAPASSMSPCTGTATWLATDGTALIPAGTEMLFGVSSANGSFYVDYADDNYNENMNGWNVRGPIWDKNGDNVSDLTQALQMGNPPLVYGGKLIASGDFKQTNLNPGYDFVYPRTAIGIDSAGTTLYLVVSDGEGVHGGDGGTANQLARLFASSLNPPAARAFELDSGLSSQLFLQGTQQSAPRRINTLTGEDSTIQINPLTSGNGTFGSVANYLRLR